MSMGVVILISRLTLAGLVVLVVTFVDRVLQSGGIPSNSSQDRQRLKLERVAYPFWKSPCHEKPVGSLRVTDNEFYAGSSTVYVPCSIDEGPLAALGIPTAGELSHIPSDLIEKLFSKGQSPCYHFAKILLAFMR
jgi:hypothetical protein